MTRWPVRTAVAAGLLLGATALVADGLRAPVESRLESLLARMTLAEKVGQR